MESNSPEQALQELARGASRTLVEPLSEGTKKLLTELHMNTNDRLHVKMTQDGRSFECQAFAETTWGLPEGEAPRRISGSHNAMNNWFRRVPERKELGYGRWVLAATDFTSIIINAMWPVDQVYWEPDAKMIHQLNLLRFLEATKGAHHRALFKLKKQLPPIPDDFVQHHEYPLSPYQLTAFASAIEQEGFALFMEQGTGKTPVVIARVCYEAAKIHREEQRMMRVLVVAPKNVRMNWAYEFEKFAVESGRVTVLRGGELKRTKLLVEAMDQEDGFKYTVIVASYEAVERTWKAIRLCDWDLVVLDESHYIKSTQTKRFKKMMELRECAKKRMCLTGTPVLNTLLDIFPQFEFLGEGLSGFNSWKNFRGFHGRFESTQRGFQKLIGYRNVPLLQERLARLAFVIDTNEANLDLPEQVYDIREISMTPTQHKLYTDMQKKLQAEISVGGQMKESTVEHILTKLLRLAQITSGHIKWDDVDDEGNPIRGEAQQIPGGNPKLDAIVEDAKSLKPNDKMIIWACWIPDIKATIKALTEAGVECRAFYGSTSEADREKAVYDFNHDPSVKVFIANAAAGGTGLNLIGYPPGSDGKPEDTGTNVTLVGYFSQNWSLGNRSQSEKRSHRIGTRVHVTYRDYVVPGTIDEEIRARVTQKKIDAMEFADIRDVMKRILETAPEKGDV